MPGGVRRGLCHSGQAKSLHSSGRRTTSIIALRYLANVDIPLDAGDFCVISRRALDTLNALPERNRFVRGMRTWIGYRQIGMAYERQARAAGEPKYTLRSLMNLALDGVVNFSYKPLRMFGILGMATGSLALLASVVFLFQYLTDATISATTPAPHRGGPP